MNIILLSGGSGKRLWPLSNDIRSKQFIRMLKNNTGDYESMIQRIYRQIKSVDENANITVATNKAQVSCIQNQLDDNVSICIEPYRRDTFPAIALAAAHLVDNQKMNTDEAVLVCPVDSYVSEDYIDNINKAYILAKKGEYNLNLMGVVPTYPSEKYGYIIPESIGNVSKVKEFKEKPDEAAAIKYIEEGALWNCGVFAFKLKYLLDIAHQIISFNDYKDLYDKYATLEKISFDYAVVEKESSISVIRFDGDWKDVGTWNMMTDVMADNIKGKATMDNECIDTQIINELNIPIIGMGCKHMVIVACNDGILVSDKERSEYLKPYVSSISSEVMFEEKSWGTYTVMDAQPSYISVKVFIRAGKQMSYLSNEYCKKILTVVCGRGEVIVNESKKLFCAGSVITIKEGHKHTVTADTDMEIVEVRFPKE